MFARIGNNESSIKALDQIGISVKTAAGEAKTSSQLIGEVAEKWDTLSDAQKQNTSIGVAGIYQLSRFNAMLNNYSIYQDAANTAANSMGSAWKEQEKYADSLQARLNRLQNKFTELAIASGDAFISDGLIAATTVLGDLLKGVTEIVKGVGFLPPAFMAANFVLVAFNKNMRALQTALVFGAGSLTDNQRAALSLETGMSRATIATRAFSGAFKGLAATTGIGLVFAGVGIALEKLTTAYADAKKSREDFESNKQTSIEAITTNKDSTDELIAQYEDLQKAKEAGTLSSEKEQEYLQVTQQLAQTFPNLISGYNSQGQAIIKNNDALKDAIKYTEDLADLNKKDIQTGANSNFKDSLKDINKLKDEVEQYQKIADRLSKGKDFWSYFEQMPFTSDKDIKNQGIKAAEEAKRVDQELVSNQIKIREQVQQTVDAYNSIKINPQLTKEINDAFNNIDFSKMKPDQLESFSINVADYMDKIQKALKSGNKDDFDSASQGLELLINQYVDGKDKANGLVLSYGDLKDAIDSTKNAAENSKVAWDENGDGVDALGDSVGTLSDKLKEAKGDLEATLNIIDDLINSKQSDYAASTLQEEGYDEVANKVSIYNELLEKVAEGKNLSATEAMKLIQKEKSLSKAISVQNGIVNINRQAVIKSRDEFIASYNDKIKAVKKLILAQANEYTVTMSKDGSVDPIKVKSLKEAKKQLAEFKKEYENALKNINNGGIQNISGAKQNYENYKKFVESLESMDKVSEITSTSLNEVGTSLENYSDEQEKASEETKTSMYVVDKYKESL
ncbi:phage tail tape measure protein, partial [Bacillus atrophaeus]|uniref:phage tail tape measure protein n=1 Tax=Bacillus atrophaeus TaxID=1452 RepID=UPI0039904F73